MAQIDDADWGRIVVGEPVDSRARGGVSRVPKFFTWMDSPLGDLLLLGDGEVLSGLYMREGRRAIEVPGGCAEDRSRFAAVCAQLEEYFAGERQAFDLGLGLEGSAFQQRVWEELSKVGYGETVTYGELAARVGRPGAARAVGLANARNPVSVVVPCHRVIGANGKLTGYGGGMESKRWLLELEAGVLALR